ncbi:MAG: hypothetical protein KF691_08225 [Phycisphaeraceae bacterium]|nr:hypothetical protein [Phycisphaeraceae bacterium]
MNSANDEVTVLQKRLLFWKRSAIGCVTGALALGIFGLQNHFERKVIGVSGGDSYIYRVYDDGSIDFIQADNQVKSAKGIPGWQAIPIDPSLKRQSR